MLLVACGAVGGRRCCWWPAELLVAIGSAGGPRFLYVSPILRITAACYALTDATAAAIAAHAAAAACAARRVFAARCWGATHAPRRMAAASRSTAIAQREEECRGSANGHPGVRAGDTPLTRLARHAGYGGGDSVERGGASSFVTLDVRLHTSRSAVNIARLSFPRDYPAGTSPYPLSSTGSTFIR